MIAYITSAEQSLESLNDIGEQLITLGWSPIYSPHLILDCLPDGEKSAPELVRTCIQQIQRADAIVFCQPWMESEICRIEHEYSRENLIPRYEVESCDDLDIPEPDGFRDKVMTVSVQRHYHHAHPRSSQYDRA